jgi:two-component system LytT family response regulator
LDESTKLNPKQSLVNPNEFFFLGMNLIFWKVLTKKLLSQTMNVLIIDDETLNVKNLEILLNENFEDLTILSTFTEAEQAKDFINKHEIDLIFLDINMPVLDGFDLLDLFPERAFEVIFVTAYEEYALKALKASAVDYILKPIILSELTTAVKKAAKRFHEKKKSTQLETISKDKKITLNYSGGKTVISSDEILYIQGVDNLSKVFFHNNQKVMVSKTLKYFEELLVDSPFFRVHKSYIINLNYCQKIISKESYILELANQMKIPISRRKYKPLCDLLGFSSN